MSKPTRSLYSSLKRNHYSIYERPLDAPNQYVVRRFEIAPGRVIPHEAWYADTIDEARALVPKDLIKIVRAEDDPPFLLETWL